MSRKMTFRQWEALSIIHNMGGSTPDYMVKSKSVLDTCVKKGYLTKDSDGSFHITNYGREQAKEEVTSLESKYPDKE